jgi:putative selenate reductase FAD-binding subunit
MITDFRRAESIAEAVKLRKAGYVYLAGGTQLNNASYRTYGGSVERVVSLDALGLDDVSVEDADVFVGAGVTLQVLAEHSAVPRALRDAAGYIPTRSVRNIATIGGNVAARRPDSYLIPALIALDAVAETVDGNVPVEEYVAGDDTTLILRFRIPPPRGVCRAVKESRSHISLPIVSAAVRVAVEDGAVTDARVVAGCVGTRTMRLPSVEALLCASDLPVGGDDSDTAGLESAISAAIDPPEDFLGTSDFKRYLNAVVIADCIAACFREASS